MQYKTVAGIGVGKPRNTVVLIDENGKPTDMVMKNRQLYVRKCLRPEQMDGIILCDDTRSDTVYALILAISDDCGKHHKLTKKQKARGESAGICMEGIEPHMKCVTPDNHEWGIIRSPYGRDEFIIREDIIKWFE